MDVLSAQALGLAEALERTMAENAPFVILGGKVFEVDRLFRTVTSVKGGGRRQVLREEAPRGANAQAVMLPGGAFRLSIWL